MCLTNTQRDLFLPELRKSKDAIRRFHPLGHIQFFIFLADVDNLSKQEKYVFLFRTKSVRLILIAI